MTPDDVFEAGRECGALEMAVMVAPALDAAYWFYRMVMNGGPDGSELDEAVTQDLAMWLREFCPVDAYQFDG